MFDYRKKLGLIALVCSIAGLSGCGGSSGTDNEKIDLPVCNNFEVLLPDGTCGQPPELPACPEGQIRVGGICITPDKPAPTYTPAEDEVVIYVNSKQKEAVFPLLNLHMWQSCGTAWADPVVDPKTGDVFSMAQTSGGGLSWPNGPFMSSNENGPELKHDDIYGAYFILKINETGSCGNFIVKDKVRAGAGDSRGQTNDLSIDIVRGRSTLEGPYDRMFFVILNDTNYRDSRVSASPICIDDICKPYEKPLLGVSDVEAHWVDQDTILWNRDLRDVKLFKSEAAGMTASTTANNVMNGGTLFATLSEAREMTEEEISKAGNLTDYYAYDIETELSNDDIKNVLKGELVILGVYDDTSGEETVERGLGTRVQIARLLDVLYADEAESETLGVSYGDSTVTVSVWAPTTQSAELRIFSGSPIKLETKVPMTLDPSTGIWSYTGTKAALDRKFYRFRFNTYNPVSKKVEILEVTDPYSVSLSTNATHSQFVNLSDSDLLPAGWDNEAPTVDSFESASIYEVHVRDFSIDDDSTSPDYRGKYLAFTEEDSAPVNHLKALKAAGLTHLHFLPLNDSFNINENFSKQLNLDSYVFELCAAVSPRNSAVVCNGAAKNTDTLRTVLESYEGNSDKQRRLVESLRSLDGFNWGYDPQHFNVPDGSYATDSNGVARIKEMRAMYQAVHDIGLRVVMDVVYPHTVSAGTEAANSVLDKVVPGYYYRKNIVSGGEENGTGAGPDTATENRMMAKFVKDSLVQWASQYKVDGFRFDQSGFMPKSVLVDSLAAVQEVDPDTYFYAEAWTPGGGTSEARIGANNRATQAALAGTGIGTFNDRIRNPLQKLHIVNGQSLNAVRAGLAGNLRDFEILTSDNEVVTADSFGAYNLDPQEAINYVEKHDNETLWDWMHRTATTLPEDTSREDRVRIHGLTLSIPLLSQGVPFFHMGSDLLRSKSMSPNSYDAGDWFNKVDFTKQSNNWAVGLPPELRDGITDSYVRTVFEDPNSKPTPADIEKSSKIFNEFLEISKSPLFSLTTAAEVINRVGFHDGGSSQVDNLIVMSIDDGNKPIGEDAIINDDLDENFDAIVVIFNGTGEEVSRKINASTGFELHPIQKESADERVKESSFEEANKGGIFTVPPYTTAVFVKMQDGEQGIGLKADVTINPPLPYEGNIYIRGTINDNWADTAPAGNKLTYKGVGVYTYETELNPGTYNFKIASATWNSPEVNKGAPTGNQAISLDTAKVLNGGENIQLTIVDAALYRFTLDANNADTPSLTVKKDFYATTPVYIRGNIVGNWGTSNQNLLVKQGDGIYSVTLPATGGTRYEFKIADSTNAWTFNKGLANPEANRTVSVGVAKTLVNGNENIYFTPPATSNYKFSFNTETDEITITDALDIYAAEPLYIRGGISGNWSASNTNKLVHKGGGVYEVTLTAENNGENGFKIANGNDNWAGTVKGKGAGAQAIALGEVKTLSAGSGSDDGTSDIKVTVVSGSDYKFSFNTSNINAPTITVTAD